MRARDERAEETLRVAITAERCGSGAGVACFSISAVEAESTAGTAAMGDGAGVATLCATSGAETVVRCGSSSVRAHQPAPTAATTPAAQRLERRSRARHT